MPDGVFTFVPNAGPGVRVDMLEMQRAPNTVEESASRDIYDTSSGLFTSSVVQKVVASHVTYRIRSAAAGAGVPAPAQGWLPLTVIGVPSTAANFDGCTIYDVRPLIRDRNNGLHNLEASLIQPKTFRELYSDRATSPGQVLFSGVFDTTGGDGYRQGGVIKWVDGGVDSPFIDLAAAANRGTFGVANFTYVWLIYPQFYPRFVRYTSTPVAPFGGRVPFGMRGIPCVTTTPPPDTNFGWFGAGSNVNLVIPDSAGLGTGNTAASATARLIAAIPNDAGNVPAHGSVRDNWVLPGFDALTGTGLAVKSVVGSTNIVGEFGVLCDEWVLSRGIQYPVGTRRLRVQVSTIFTAAAGTDVDVEPSVSVRAPANRDWATQFTQGPRLSIKVPAAGNFSVNFEVEIDVPLLQTSVPTLHVRVNWVSSSGGLARNVANSIVEVDGWELQ